MNKYPVLHTITISFAASKALALSEILGSLKDTVEGDFQDVSVKKDSFKASEISYLFGYSEGDRP